MRSSPLCWIERGRRPGRRGADARVPGGRRVPEEEGQAAGTARRRPMRCEHDRGELHIVVQLDVHRPRRRRGSSGPTRRSADEELVRRFVEELDARESPTPQRTGADARQAEREAGARASTRDAGRHGGRAGGRRSRTSSSRRRPAAATGDRQDQRQARRHRSRSIPRRSIPTTSRC